MATAAALLSAKTTTGAGSPLSINKANASFQASVVGTGAVTATVLVEVSNDGVYWVTIYSFSLSGTTSASDVFSAFGPWAFVRGNVSAISGTGAAVTLTAGA